MRISVVARKPTWHTDALIQEASKMGVSLSLQDISSPEDVDTLGDIVIWRSASISKDKSKRNAIFQKLLREKVVFFNRAIETLPSVTDKDFQQSYLKEKASFINTIPSLKFSSKNDLLLALNEGRLSYPFIQKPARGDKGTGVVLIRDKEALEKYCQDTLGNIYQRFIPNNGDYRALVLGGKMLGVIHRRPQADSYLNNISQGSIASAVTDTGLLKSIERIATTAACVFDLHFCGVDIIQDQEGNLCFLEVNTVPQWQGFQSATGVNVAQEIIRYSLALTQRSTKSLADLISDYYWESLPYFDSRKPVRFHLISRLHLWNQNDRTTKEIRGLRHWFFFGEENSIAENLRKKLSEPFVLGPNSIERKLRVTLLDKYPLVAGYNRLLFMRLFGKLLYKQDLGEDIRTIVPDEDFIRLYKELSVDYEAICGLATHALNYLYLTDHFFLSSKESERLDPTLLLAIGEKYFIEQLPSQPTNLAIYYFTHCLIGASLFYSQNIIGHSDTYSKMLSLTEKLVAKNYNSLSLDTKFEFLICTRLLNTPSNIETKIMSEAQQSLSPFGNYLVDTLNETREKKSSLIHSEHRNVLFLMLLTNRN